MIWHIKASGYIGLFSFCLSSIGNSPCNLSIMARSAFLSFMRLLQFDLMHRIVSYDSFCAINNVRLIQCFFATIFNNLLLSSKMAKHFFHGGLVCPDWEGEMSQIELCNAFIVSLAALISFAAGMAVATTNGAPPLARCGDAGAGGRACFSIFASRSWNYRFLSLAGPWH